MVTQLRSGLACIALTLIMSAATNFVNAENKVTIATIGASPNIDKNQAPDKLVEQMLDFWRGQLRHCSCME